MMADTKMIRCFHNKTVQDAFSNKTLLTVHNADATYLKTNLDLIKTEKTHRILIRIDHHAKCQIVVNLKISLNSIAALGSLAPSALALLFCFSLITRSLSIVTTWN